MPLPGFERDVDAVLLQIHRDVLPEIGELQRRAGGVRKALPLGVRVAAQIQHQPSHRIRRIAAVAEQLLPVAIARDGLVLHERADQIGERLAAGCACRSMVAQQRHEHRMARAALRTCASSSLAPPVEQAQALARVADLVAQIVRPAAERVDVVEILMQALRQQEADDVEVLVVMGGEPARIGAALLRACSARAMASGDRTKSAGAQERILRNDRGLQVAVVAHQVPHHFEQVGQRLFAVDEVTTP